jgi:hypothetical protein
MAQVNILKVSVLKERQQIHDNIDEKLIYPDIKAVQDIYLPQLLGTALYNKIISDITGNTLAGIYKTLVDDYVIDVLINYTLAELPMAISYQFWNKGILRKTSDNTESPGVQEIQMIADKYKRRGDMYAEKTRRYLLQHQTSFSEYLNPGNGIDTVFPDKNYNMPIYLGDDDDCKCNYI